MHLTVEAIKSRCSIEGDCWIWQGPLIRKRPYLSVHEAGVRFNRRVQKEVLKLSGEKVPGQAPITQSCGNPLCCAPAHQQVHVPRGRAGFLQAMKGNPWAALLWSAASV